jgi:transmembrane sensor
VSLIIDGYNMKEEKKFSKDKIIQYLNGELEESGKSELYNWIQQNDQNFRYYMELRESWNFSALGKGKSGADTDASWNKISNKIKVTSSPGIHNFSYKLLKYAAVFIIGFGIAFACSVLIKSKSSNISSGYNQIIVPKGQKSQVILEDGTKIWLNSETILKYPTHFTNNHREVYLKGEAYFDVQKKKHSDFRVKMDGLNIRVLGTTFNVKCYPEEQTIETTLLRGIVAIQRSSGAKESTAITLQPNQKATYSKVDQQISISRLKEEKVAAKAPAEEHLKQKPAIEATPENIVSWKDNVLVFDNESLNEIVTKLKRWYGFNVEVKSPSLLSQRYKGKFSNYETIYQVLDAIKLTTPLKYSVKDKTITIEKLN